MPFPIRVIIFFLYSHDLRDLRPNLAVFSGIFTLVCSIIISEGDYFFYRCRQSIKLSVVANIIIKINVTHDVIEKI